MRSEFGEIMQLGYIVEDLNATVMEWVNAVGAGPFYLIEGQTLENYHYRGNRCHAELSIAFGYWGEMQIELVQPLKDEGDFYNNALATGAGKINHYCTIVNDLDGLIKKHKLEDKIVHSGGKEPGAKFVYLEEYLPGGLHLELVQAPERALQGYAGMKAITSTWDGNNPIRSMASLAEDLAALHG